MDRVRSLLERAVAERVTPGGQLSVRWWSSRARRWQAEDIAFGALEYEPDAPRASTSTLYDLASVSKALFALAALSWAEREGLSLDTPARALWAESRGTDAGDATLDSLFSHRSELRAWAPLFREVSAREAGAEAARAKVLSRLLSERREPNGRAARYSDLGYIVAGEAVARGSGRSLDALVRERVLAPLEARCGALTTSYRPVLEWMGLNSSDVAPTERCSWRGDAIVRGLVHDENAYALGGVCGHAGLFGTARDLAIIGEASLRAMRGEEVGDGWIPPSVLRAMAAPREGGSHRLGWDGKSASGSSAGERASAETFGHLGFTGTMLWCDPTAAVVVALVTNRVHPTRENQGIRALRPAVMDAVFEALADR
jgi:CubicO group peptidase (beta-lactamase class C family)